ncbi:hypothetical protein PDIDSM_1112 [Penicillium digitatum]|nr:hypothetical protein PDIDSM_1112 [Penicillium digitatum]
MIHITRHRGDESPSIVVNDRLTIDPVQAKKPGYTPTLRWLGVFFDRKLTWRSHILARAGKARAVAQHIRNLAARPAARPRAHFAKQSSPAWYGGRNRPAKQASKGTVSARVGWHINVIESTLALAIRGVLPVWRTTPTPSLFRDAGSRLDTPHLKRRTTVTPLSVAFDPDDHPRPRHRHPPTAKTIIETWEHPPEVPRPTLSPRTTHRAAE